MSVKPYQGEWSSPEIRAEVQQGHASVLFFINGHSLHSINDYKSGFKHLLKTSYVAGFLIKGQAFKPYKILPCQVLLVLLFCRWRNLEFEKLNNKPQIWQLGRAEPRHKP